MASHGQRAVGHSGVVMLAEGEAGHPAGGHARDRVQTEFPLAGRDLGAVPVPPGAEPAGREAAQPPGLRRENHDLRLA